MSLDLTKLEKIRSHGEKITARCPAYAENGGDRTGNHLIVQPDGRFGCVVCPGVTSEARRHRSRIFALCGLREVRLLLVGKPPTARDSQSAKPIKANILGRLGRLFPSRSQPNSVSSSPSAVDQRSTIPVPPVPGSCESIEPHRPLTERERVLLMRWCGRDRHPLIFEAIRLFDGMIVGAYHKQQQPTAGKSPTRTKLGHLIDYDKTID
jgi:hypothetical protein